MPGHCVRIVGERGFWGVWPLAKPRARQRLLRPEFCSNEQADGPAVECGERRAAIEQSVTLIGRRRFEESSRPFGAQQRVIPNRPDFRHGRPSLGRIGAAKNRHVVDFAAGLMAWRAMMTLYGAMRSNGSCTRADVAINVICERPQPIVAGPCNARSGDRRQDADGNDHTCQ